MSCVWVVFAFRIQIAEHLSALRLVTASRLPYTLTNFYKLLKRLRKVSISIWNQKRSGYRGFSNLVPQWVEHAQRLVCRVAVIFILPNSASINDDINVSRWEHFAHLMAKECGINVAETQVIRTGADQDILLSKRFDRSEDNKRIHMASSLTVLGFTDGDGQRTGKGYLDIVDFIVSGGGNHIETNLEELYKRVAFNICIGNSDDHFRNHSFLLGKEALGIVPCLRHKPNKWYVSGIAY